MAAPVAGIAGLAVLPFEALPTMCPFALITGTACPGCGLTRSAVALVRGDLGAALALHPLVLVVAAWLLGWWLAGVARRNGRRLPLERQVVDRLLALTGVAFALTWVVRMVAGTLPPV